MNIYKGVDKVKKVQLQNVRVARHAVRLIYLMLLVLEGLSQIQGGFIWKLLRNMRYFKCNKDFVFVYSNTDDLEIIGYIDSDFAGSPDLMKAALGYMFKIAGGGNFIEKF